MRPANPCTIDILWRAENFWVTKLNLFCQVLGRTQSSLVFWQIEANVKNLSFIVLNKDFSIENTIAERKRLTRWRVFTVHHSK